MSHHFNIEMRLLFVPSFMVTWSRVADSKTWLLQFHKRKADKMFLRFFLPSSVVSVNVSFASVFLLAFFVSSLWMQGPGRSGGEDGSGSPPLFIGASLAFQSVINRRHSFSKIFFIPNTPPPPTRPPSHLASLITVQYWFRSFKMH